MFKQLMVGAALTAALASGANASSITVGSGDSFSVNFNGVVEGTEQAGLTASATFNIGSVNYNAGTDTTTWSLSIELANTSSSPITASRVSVLGFNTDPNIVSGATTSGIFDTVSSGNMPQVGRLEVCLTDVNCAGGGGTGVALGSVASLMATLTFDGDIGQVTFDNFAVHPDGATGAAGNGLCLVADL